MDNENIPIVNSSELYSTQRLWRMWAGACAPTTGYVWADSEESAFEEWVEYLDEHAPGYLVSHEYFQELVCDAIEELYPECKRLLAEPITMAGRTWHPTDVKATIAAFEATHGQLCGVINSAAEKVLKHAEADLTLIGHTSLKHGSHIQSWEWGLDEIDPDSDEYKQAHARTLQEVLDANVNDLAELLLDEVKNTTWEPEEQEDGRDVRLAVESGGQWELLTGDVCYDTRHATFCAAGTLTREAGMAECVDLARELIDDVCEQVTQ